MSTTSTGRAAEAVAAEYLVRRGFALLDRNWRNRWCELDIVAAQGGRLHFVEVKYRATSFFGAPAEYVNHDKLVRLQRAALAYNQAHGHHGTYQIDVISLTGPLEHPAVDYLADITG